MPFGGAAAGNFDRIAEFGYDGGMSSDDTIQLDLTESITDVPQANSISLFIQLLEALRGEQRSIPTLASLLEVDERTVRYYVEFGRWLRWLEPTDDHRVALTGQGRAFVDSEPARGRLFANALFDRPLIKTVQKIKREQLDEMTEPSATREACRRAVDSLTTLSEATVRRRASAITSMLKWAYNPGGLDWSTGQPTQTNEAPFDFRGQSFLTAYGARQFGDVDTIHIGFPRQVVSFGLGTTDRLRDDRWPRASYDTDAGTARWFGSIPINTSTLSVARRGGPDLRRLLISCNPYLAMLATLLTSPSTAQRCRTKLTFDMYGLRLWHKDHELGGLLEALATLAARLDLVPVENVPHLDDYTSDQLKPADEHQLAELLEHTGIVRPVDTVLILAPGVASELRLPIGDSPTLWERMEPLRSDLSEALRHRGGY